VWVTLVLPTAVFALLAYSAHVVPYFPFELTLSQAIQGLPVPWLHALLVAVSWPGFPPQIYIFVVLVAILFYALHRRREAVVLVASSVGIALISQGVKLLVDRPRPSPTLVHVLIPGLNGGHWSFPAGHTESFVVVFGFILYVVYTEWRPNIVRTLVSIFSLSRFDFS
jgi:membrane-associated phospholipid phosphatase